MGKTFSLKLILAIIFIAIGFKASKEINSFLSISYQEKNLEKQLEGFEGQEKNSFHLDLRIVDMGGVGITPDTASWGDNYKHNEHRFEDLIIADYPYIDSLAYRRIFAEFDYYLKRMAQFDFNAITIAGFMEFVNFEFYKSGFEIYPEDSEYRKRHLALRSCFNQFINLANELGFKVYLYTDMVALSEPFETFLIKKLGKVDTESDELWEIYQTGAQEIFEYMPNVEGFYIRIGEAGTVYNNPGWDYYSELYVQKDKAVKKMLESFLEIAEKYHKSIIFRTWSVGVGEVGDMHTNIETYQRVLDNITSDRLIVSTKFTNGDFYGWLPFNYTLYQGKHPRIVEFQCRREFEGFNSWPNYLAKHHQAALKSFSKSNENINGIWLWTQGGGPLRAGPLSIYPFHGFNVVTDLNVYAMGQIANNINVDLEKVTKDWIHLYFGENEVLVKNLIEMFDKSHKITLQGLYISEFAKYYVKALSLEPPPMLWIFEWDIVSGASSALGAIYFVSKENIESAISEGFEALNGVRKMKQLTTEAAPFVSKNHSDYTKLIESIEYQENLFELLAYYRSYFLNYYHWLENGEKENRERWESDLAIYKEKEQFHQEKYKTNLDFPSFNFREANEGVKVAEKSSISSLAAKVLIFILMLSLISSVLVSNSYSFCAFCKSFWLSIFIPETSTGANFRKGYGIILGFVSLLIVISILAFTSFHSFVFAIFLIVLTFSYVLGLHFGLGGFKARSNSVEILSLVSLSVLMLLIPIFLSAYRAPMLFWYKFWTSEDFRTIFVTLFVFLSLWSYLAIFLRANKVLGIPKIKTLAIIFTVQGLQFIIGSAIVIFIGFENFLTLINDELLVLPGGLSRILGITVHLNIPLALPYWILYLGLILFMVGLASFLILRRVQIFSPH